jgi:hypothetical protein
MASMIKGRWKGATFRTFSQVLNEVQSRGCSWAAQMLQKHREQLQVVEVGEK